jgi:hypothetical protein
MVFKAFSWVLGYGSSGRELVGNALSSNPSTDKKEK